MPIFLVSVVIIAVWMVSQHLERYVYDFLCRITAVSATTQQAQQSSPITLVVIDDESLRRLEQRFGTSPWSKDTYLEIFNAIQQYNPKAIVADIHFTDLISQDASEAFKDMQEVPGLVLGMTLNYTAQGMPDKAAEFLKLDRGLVHTPLDSDGVLRELVPFVPVRMGKEKPSVLLPVLSLQSVITYLEQLQPENSLTFEIQKGHQLLALLDSQQNKSLKSIPLNPEGKFYIRWSKLMPNLDGEPSRRSHVAIPLWHFFTEKPLPEVDQQVLKDRLVLLGASAQRYRDFHPTPMSTHHLGVDIHANAIDTLLLEQAVYPVSKWLQIILMLAVCTIIFLLRRRVKHIGRSLTYMVTFMLFYLWLGVDLFSHHGWLIDVVTPVSFIFLSFAFSSSLQEYQGTQKVNTLTDNLSTLVSQAVLDEIGTMDSLEAGGRRMDMTAIFVDIRNFTAMAEKMPESELTELLNEFYTVIQHVVVAHHGTINKFMGDGILILFGAPIENQAHADEAIKAVKDMLLATDKLSRRWEKERGIRGEIGISVNSGKPFVGFMGPQSRLEYTAVGDAINICVRLQETIKEFDTRVIISEYTKDRLENPDQLVLLGKVSVRGRGSSLIVYTIESDSLES